MVEDKHKFSEDELEQRRVIIKEYVDNGKTYEEMCALLGCGMGSFYRRLRKYNIPPRKVGRRHKKK